MLRTRFWQLILKSWAKATENKSNGFCIKDSSARRRLPRCPGHGDQPWGWLWKGQRCLVV